MQRRMQIEEKNVKCNISSWTQHKHQFDNHLSNQQRHLSLRVIIKDFHI